MTRPTTIVVVADTHLTESSGRTLPEVVWAAIEGADLVLHAGDVTDPALLAEIGARTPVVAVLGNNDRCLDHLPERWCDEVGGVRLAMVHDSGARTGRENRMRRWFPDADVVVFGHSHEPVDAPGADGQWLLNPGSPTQRRRQPHRSFATLQVGDGRFETRIVTIPT